MHQPHETLSVVREMLADLLRADPLFARAALPVPVIAEQKGDIETQIAEAISKLGLAAIVVAADGGLRQKTGSLAISLRLVIQISEDVVLNNAAAEAAQTTPIRAIDLAAQTMRVIAAEGRHFVLDETPLDLVPDMPVPTYQVHCHSIVRLF